MTKSYFIAEGKVSRFNDGIAALNKKARKLGVAEIVTVWTGNKRTEDIKRNEIEPHCDFAVRLEVVGVRTWLEVEVTGESPKFAGWVLAAVIEATPEGNMLRKSPSCEIELAHYRTCRPECEHCHTNRQRRETFVVLHDSGTLKQVGRNCIANFLGHKDPHTLAAQSELFFSLSELCDEGAVADDFGGGGSGPELINVGTFLAYVALACRVSGYISRAASEATDKTPTSSEATTYMFPPRNKWGAAMPKPETLDRERAEAARSYVLNQFGAMAPESLSDFQSNLFTACKCEAVTRKSLGILAFVVEYHAREIDKSLAREREFGNAKAAGHYGTPKVRARNVEIIYTKSTGFDSQFGYTYIHTFRTKEGHLLKWKTGTELTVRPGQHVAATFTVKEHKVWNDFPETAIARVEYAPVAEQKEAA